MKRFLKQITSYQLLFIGVAAYLGNRTALENKEWPVGKTCVGLSLPCLISMGYIERKIYRRSNRGTAGGINPMRFIPMAQYFFALFGVIFLAEFAVSYHAAHFFTKRSLTSQEKKPNGLNVSESTTISCKKL